MNGWMNERTNERTNVWTNIYFPTTKFLQFHNGNKHTKWKRGGLLTLRSDLVLFTGDSLERSYLFYDQPSTLSSNAPAFRGQSRLKWFRLCVRSPCVINENNCNINYEPKVALPSTFCPRTQHVWWDHREKSRRASTIWDCQGKSRLAGLSPVNGT